MGIVKYRRKLVARGGIAIGASGVASTLDGTMTGASTGKLDMTSGTAILPNGTATANGTANLATATPGMVRISKNGATIQFGFVIGGSAFSFTATSGGTVTLVNHT